MGPIDLKKSLKVCYQATREVRLVEVPPIKFVAFEGKGDPVTSEEYRDSMGVLYGLVYTIKFIAKETDESFSVMPLEAQWWAEDPAHFAETARDDWRWDAMIAVPDFVDERLFDRARAQLRKKKDPPGLEKARLEIVKDGLAAQFLYLGPYSGEAPFIAEMHGKIAEMGYRLRGRHREIYLNSPQRVAPEKLKTIIRHPVERA